MESSSEKPEAMTDAEALQRLIAAVDRYMAAKGGPEVEWILSFNALLVALQQAKTIREKDTR